MAYVEPVNVQVNWDYNDTGYKQLVSDMDTAQRKYADSSSNMDRSNIRMLRSISRLTSGYYTLYGVIDLVSSGEADMTRLIPRIIGLMVSLTATIYSLVGAEKARAIAHSVANALSGPAGWAILAGAAAMVGIGIGLAASIPSRQAGGPIYRTGFYKLERGEVYSRGMGSGVSIVITGNTITSETLPVLSKAMIEKLRSSGVI